MDAKSQLWFQSYCDARRGVLRQSSRVVYGAWWSCFVAYVDSQGRALDEITSTDVDYFLRLQAPNTSIRYYRLISAVYDIAVDHGLCTHNPMIALRSVYDRKESRTTTDGPNSEAIKALYSLPRGATWKKQRDRILVILAAEAALRRSDLLNLCVSQLHLDSSLPYIAFGGGMVMKKVELPLSASAELQQWLGILKALHMPGELVFPTDLHGNPLNPATAYRIIEKYLARVGAGKAVFGASGTHILRAGKARQSKKDGNSLQDIKEQLGHKRILSTAELLARLPSK